MLCPFCDRPEVEFRTGVYSCDCVQHWYGSPKDPDTLLHKEVEADNKLRRVLLLLALIINGLALAYLLSQ